MKRLIALLVLVASCSPPATPPAESKPAPDSKVISFQAPREWTRETPATNMRKAQYRVPDKEKTERDAELAIFYFGDTPALMQANIDRWVGQMRGSVPKTETFEGKCKVTFVDLSGPYSSDQGGEPIRDARMLAAVVEASDGPWYFKLVGPAETVADWREEFVALLKGAVR